MEVVKALTTIANVDTVQKDNAVFKLHYRFTVMLLVVFSVLVTTKQYFGDPIKCDIGGSSKDLQSTVETFCWIYGTYTVRSGFDNTQVPGLGNEVGREQTWHLYYQWVAVVLLVQAFFFYIPCYLWNLWEGGRLEKLVKDLDGPLVPTAWNDDTKNRLVHYLTTFEYLHTLYAFRYLLCELLNFVNVIFQLLLTNWLLKGEFSMYGISVFNFDGVGENPFSAVFPKTTKCKYRNYGPSGSLQNYDFLCILPLNVLNEKLYFVLWLWMILVAILSFLMVLFRLLIVAFPKLRGYLLLVQVRCFDMEHMENIVNSINYGSFFVLYLIGKNCHPFVFKDLVSALYETVKSTRDVKIRNKRNDVIIV